MLVFLAPLLTQIGILSHYVLDQSYYKSICINKAKPMLHCNGKCQLMKKLAKADFEGQKPDLQRSIKFEPEPFVCPSYPIVLEWEILEHTSDNNFKLPSLSSNQHVSDIFHPPAFLV